MESNDGLMLRHLAEAEEAEAEREYRLRDWRMAVSFLALVPGAWVFFSLRAFLHSSPGVSDPETTGLMLGSFFGILAFFVARGLFNGLVTLISDIVEGLRPPKTTGRSSR